MHCLWCFWSRRSRHQRNKRLRRPVGQCSNPVSQEATQPQSQSQILLRTPSPRPLADASNSSLSSASSGSIVCVVPLEGPFVTKQISNTSAPQSSHTTGPLDKSARLTDTQSSSTATSLRMRKTNDTYGPINSLRSHNSRMASRTRSVGPQFRKDSPTLPATRMSSASFSARVAIMSTQDSFTAHATLPQPTFLDDDSSSSDDVADHRCDDSGYISTLTTPAKPNDSNIASVVGSTIQSPLLPMSLTVDMKPVFTPPPLNPLHPQTARIAKLLCDQRHCLRHKHSCLEHSSSLSPPTSPIHISQPRTQERHLRRRPRVCESRRFEDDVWLQIASDYLPGA